MSENTSAVEMLRAMGIDPEEAMANAVAKDAMPRTDKRVCSCGHGISRHESVDRGEGRGEIVTCRALKQNCMCKKIDPVLVAEDTRLFLRRTDGPLGAHALTQGIVASANAGKGVEWIPDSHACVRCGSVEEPLTMTPINPVAFTVADHETGHNYFLCSVCFLKGD